MTSEDQSNFSDKLRTVAFLRFNISAVSLSSLKFFEVVFELKEAAEMTVEILSPTGQVIENQKVASFIAGENRLARSNFEKSIGGKH